MTDFDQAAQSADDARIRSRLARLAVFTAVGLVGLVATLPFVRLSPGFLAYAAVVSVVSVGLTWKVSGVWAGAWPGILAGGTIPWAVRTFYDLPPILSLTGLHIGCAFFTVVGSTFLLARSFQHRGLLPPRPLREPHRS